MVKKNRENCVRRFCQRAYLKPEMIETYKNLHAAVWPDVLKMIKSCHLQNYSISVIDDMVVTFFEYTGNDYEADMRRMEEDPVTQKWWTYTHPCFRDQEKNIYYDDLNEIFYLE